MAIFAAMGQGKPRGIAEAIGCAMHHFRHHRQRAHCARAYARVSSRRWATGLASTGLA